MKQLIQIKAESQRKKQNKKKPNQDRCGKAEQWTKKLTPKTTENWEKAPCGKKFSEAWSHRISIHIVTFPALLAAVHEASFGLSQPGVFIRGKAAHLDF